MFVHFNTNHDNVNTCTCHNVMTRTCINVIMVRVKMFEHGGVIILICLTLLTLFNFVFVLYVCYPYIGNC